MKAIITAGIVTTRNTVTEVTVNTAVFNDDEDSVASSSEEERAPVEDVGTSAGVVLEDSVVGIVELLVEVSVAGGTVESVTMVVKKEEAIVLLVSLKPAASIVLTVSVLSSVFIVHFIV